MQRFKDCDPKETVRHIQDILADLGVHPEGELLSFAGKFFSMRIEDPATGLGSNGKGASPDLAWASAYGEFMERLQSDFLLNPKVSWHKTFTPKSDRPEDFKYWPDEHRATFTEAIESCPEILHDMVWNYVRDGIVGSEEASRATEAEILNFWRPNIGETVIMVPYYCVGTDSLVDLPENIVRKLDMSNGLASGNTPEEALVEGMSEICERYARNLIINNELCPPPVPKDFIEEHCPEQAEMLRVIKERSPGLNVVILDASLGKGIPTVCVLFINQLKGTIRPMFGAHPCFAIALERCMTEQYQGYSPEYGIDNEVYTTWDSWSRKSVHYLPMMMSALTCDRYTVPDRMLAGKPDWGFKPWGIDPCYTNKEGVHQMKELLMNLGGQVYIRDNGYLGVPAYRIHVPGVSSLPSPGGEYAVLAEKHGILVSSALIAYSKGDLKTAATLLKLNGGQNDLCAAQELLCRSEGMPEEERDRLLETYFGPSAATYARVVWRSDNAVTALEQFMARKKWLENLTNPHKPEKNPYRDPRINLCLRLREHKAANPLDQMRVSEIFK